MRIHKRKPVRNPDYLIWVSQQPCVVCGYEWSDAHHAKGNKKQGGMGQKASDLTAFPLCRTCHTDFHDHGWKTWERAHGAQSKYYLGTLARAIDEGVL